MAIKNPTQWFQGYVVGVGNENITTNSGLLLATNSGSLLVTTPTYTTPKNPTTWAGSGI